MLIHTSLPTQTLSHAWNAHTVPYAHQLAPPMRPERYATQLQLYSGQDKDINIDDVLLEAEYALQVAETSLSSPKTNESTLLTRSIDAFASGIGGIIFGAILGSILWHTIIPDLDLLISSPLILPSFVLGTIGFASGFSNTQTAAAIRSVLGSPVKGMLSSLGLVALQQVEKGAEEVKSIPSKMADSMTKKVDEIVEYPSKLATATKNKVSGTRDEISSSISRRKDETLQSLERINLVGVMLAIMLPIIIWIFSTSQPF
mmetsp:Transcript_39042/g.94393  ORF Transcript_39042/g.94393 Transcript_39042/m.94393 type:complete len:259 (+) Transcript_39042:27-803(+)